MVPAAARFVGAVGAVVSVEPAVMVKLTFEISKKIWFEPFTMIRFCVPARFGTVMDCDPSFGVAARIVTGYVFPPSVDNKISTLAALTPLAVVPATFHVTVCVDPPAHVTAVFGALTVNGPAVPLTVMIMSSLLFAGPPA